MRLPESNIMAAILHREEEVRLAALSYFSGSLSQDEAVMPIVIQAVERYGRREAFRILRSAESLAQTPASVDWLIGELRRDYALDDLVDDNHRFAAALVLCQARPELLLGRQGELAGLAAFPDPLRVPLAERLDMLSWDWNRSWTALEALGQATLRKAALTANDVRYARRVIESLARHRATGAAAVLECLKQPHAGGSESLIEWLRPWVVNLAGAMGLDSAIPLLVQYLAHDSLPLADESITALIRIGTDAVVRAIAGQWRDADVPFRTAASEVLEHLHTDLCVERSLAFFQAENVPETKLALAYALLSQFLEEAVEPIRQLVLGDDKELPPSRRDIRYRLVAACAVMGVTFPEFGQWHRDAEADHWGLADYTTPRLADSFRPEQPGPKRSRNGRRH